MSRSDAPEPEKIIAKEGDQASQETKEDGFHKEIHEMPRAGAAGAQSMEQLIANGKELAQKLGSPELAQSFNRIQELMAQASRAIGATDNVQTRAALENDWKNSQKEMLQGPHFALVANLGRQDAEDLMKKLQKNA